MRLNKKGITTVAIAFYSTMVVMVAVSVALTPSHRERKAIEFCSEVKPLGECQVEVATWSKEEILEFIKDTPQGEYKRFVFGVPNPRIQPKTY